MKKYFWPLLLTVFFFISLGSCNKSAPDSPEQAVKNFVNAQFDGATIDELQNLSTGELLESLNSLDDNDVKKLLDVSKFQFKSLKILQKSENPEDASITYVISYKDTSALEEGQSASNALVESKKICLLRRVDGVWKLADITEFKTVIEGHSPIQ
jgi:hypothetical protein